MKTLLIKPNSKHNQYGAIEHLSAIEMPIWLLLMSNLYEDSTIIDAEAENLSLEQLNSKVEELNPDKIVILATGSHPSAYVQQREAAEELTKLISKYNVETFYRLTFDPIKVGRPQWDKLKVNLYRAHNWHCFGGLDRNLYASIFTSVSCPYNCNFCCIKSFYCTEYRVRPIEEVAQDFYELYNLGVRNYKIMDELFLTKSKRFIDLSNRLSDINNLNIWAYARIDTVNEKILKAAKKMGVTWLAYGIETGNEDIRKMEQKGTFSNSKIQDIIKMTKDIGINCLGNYIFGFNKDTKETMQETLDFAKKLNCEYSNFYCLIPYPGSKIYNDLIMSGRKFELKYAQYSLDFIPLDTEYLTGQEILEFRDSAFNDYFTNSDYLKLIETKFGSATLKEVKDMTKIKLERTNG